MKKPTLIAVLEPDDNSFEVRHGPAATDPRIVDAIRHYEKLYADEKLPDISEQLPKSIAKEAAQKIKDLINEYNKQFRSFANEEDITGFVKGRLHDTVVERDDCRVAIKTWTYARNPKEKQLGVDLGIIIDILRDGRRIIKALWVQAKRSETAPDDILTLEDLEGQIEDMQRHTSEAYVLVYTADEARMYKAEEPNEVLPIETVMYDSILCERGDRDPVVVALTGDSKIVLEVLVTA